MAGPVVAWALSLLTLSIGAMGAFPTHRPTQGPTDVPTAFPTPQPTDSPTNPPTNSPTWPTPAPTWPTPAPTPSPTFPTKSPTDFPTPYPTPSPTMPPTPPTKSPTNSPTPQPTPAPTHPAPPPTAPPTSHPFKFPQILHLSDFHLNTFYYPEFGTAKGCQCTLLSYPPSPDINKTCGGTGMQNKFGQYGCDSSVALLDSALSAAARISNPDLIIVTGDYDRHPGHNSPDPVKQKLNATKFIVDKIDQFFPNVPKLHHYYSLGNSDFYPEYRYDDKAQDTISYMKSLSDILAPYLDSYALDKFKSFGYYSVRVGGLYVIALNTIVWSVKHEPATTTPDPLDQFYWLNSTLSHVETNNLHALITGHIAPGEDNYYKKPMWQAQYVDAFLKLAVRYNKIITGFLFGHEHRNEIRLLKRHQTTEPIPAPMLLSSSLSPYFNNTPSFRVFEYDPQTYKFIDFTVFATDLTQADWGYARELQWNKQFSCRELFNLNSTVGLSEALNELPKLFLSKPQYLDAYIAQKYGLPSLAPPCDDQCKKQEYCMIEYVVDSDYNNCL